MSINDYLDFSDLKEKLGYKKTKQQLGDIGRALIQLCWNNSDKSQGWLKHQLNEYFRKQKRKNNNSKRYKKYNDKN